MRETKALVAHSRQQSAPQLAGRLEPFAKQYVQFVITNVGGGAARDVYLQMEIGDLTSRWKHSVFEAGRREEFFLPAAETSGPAGRPLKILVRDKVHLVVTLRYFDLDGREIDAAIREIDCAAVLALWDDARWHLPESELHQVGQVVQDKLETIAQAVAGGFESISKVER